MQQLILVDKNDQEIGLCEKLEAHEKALLHRAFSVYVFNENHEVLLQQRALTKYHSPGIRANTCCSHQYPEEANDVAAHRRLGEEMGFDCTLKKVSEFVYCEPVPPGLTEHEYLHVFFGTYAGQEINPVPEEVHDYARVSLADMEMRVKQNDPTLSPWTKVTWKRLNFEIEKYL